MSVRVYELAKELNKSNKEILDFLKSKNIELKSHMSNVEASQADMVRANSEREISLQQVEMLQSRKVAKSPRRKLFRCSALRTPVMCRSADRNPSARQTTARNREIMRSVRITGREKTEVHRNP